MQAHVVPEQVACVFHFTGEGVAPESTPLGELISILEKTEKAIRTRAHEEGWSHQISLVGVQKGSNRVLLSAKDPERIRQYFCRAANSLRTNQLYYFSLEEREAIDSYIQFSERHRGRLYISASLGEDPLFSFGPDPIPWPDLRIQGETTVYGRLIRLGGKDPKITITNPNTKKGYLGCDATIELVKQLGDKLYQWVGLDGTATWNMWNWSMESFVVSHITEYDGVSLAEALSGLANVSEQETWCDLNDMTGKIQDMRGEDE